MTRGYRRASLFCASALHEKQSFAEKCNIDLDRRDRMC